MAKDNGELASKLQGGGPPSPAAFNHDIKSWFQGNKNRLCTLMGSKEQAQRLYVSLLFSVERNPKILNCSKESVVSCLMQSAELTLFPGALSECHYVPYKDKLTFIPDYRGFLKLAKNSGLVTYTRLGVVREFDEFEFSEGTGAYIKHTRKLNAERGEMIAAYCVLGTPSGEEIEIMDRLEIEAIRARSSSYRAHKKGWISKDGCPWVADENSAGEMWKKTVLKRALKRQPKETKLAKALMLDNDQESESPGQLLDIPAENLFASDGEQKEAE